MNKYTWMIIALVLAIAASLLIQNDAQEPIIMNAVRYVTPSNQVVEELPAEDMDADAMDDDAIEEDIDADAIEDDMNDDGTMDDDMDDDGTMDDDMNDDGAAEDEAMDAELEVELNGEIM